MFHNSQFYVAIFPLRWVVVELRDSRRMPFNAYIWFQEWNQSPSFLLIKNDESRRGQVDYRVIKATSARSKCFNIRPRSAWLLWSGLFAKTAVSAEKLGRMFLSHTVRMKGAAAGNDRRDWQEPQMCHRLILKLFIKVNIRTVIRENGLIMLLRWAPSNHTGSYCGS